MSEPLSKRLERAVEALPRTYAGPGGAVAVVHEGEVLVRHAWGWANAERHLPFTPRTLFRFCSITKQFTCSLLLDAFADPTTLDADVEARLPRLAQEAPKILHLCHNQSGLRDYWALAMLQGAGVETAFGDAEAARLIGATRTLQFVPGTRYSYCNQNFRLLSEILAARTGRSFAELLRSRIFQPLGMDGAFLAADTRAMPDGTEGYEGTPSTGFRAAENRIHWTGDAGLGASLDDMIAWERSIDASRDDAGSRYRRLSAPVAFADGTPAGYGYGLARWSDFGRRITGHGGALRGWRSQRLHVASERLSIVVVFNHLADAHAAAADVLAAVLGEARPGPDPSRPSPTWLGAYVEPETGLAVRIEGARPGEVRLRYGHPPDLLDLQPDGTACGPDARLRPGEGGLWLDLPTDNQRSLLHPCPGDPSRDVAGRYRSDEMEADLIIAEAGGVLYGSMAGVLGTGRMEMLDPVGPDIWVLPCPRALDHTPPGDWTLAFRRDASGTIAGVEVGCWLARHISYMRVDHPETRGSIASKTAPAATA